MTYAAEHITGTDPELTLMVGVDTGNTHGYLNCGAKGSITGIGNALPREVLHLVTLCERAQAGDHVARRDALELEAALKVLSTFDEGTDLVLYYKYLMVLEGQPRIPLHFIATDVLSDSQRALCRRQLKLFRAWYAAWPAAQASVAGARLASRDAIARQGVSRPPLDATFRDTGQIQAGADMHRSRRGWYRPSRWCAV